MRRLTSGAGEFLQASVDGSIRRKFGSARLCGKLGRRLFSLSCTVQLKPPFRFLMRRAANFEPFNFAHIYFSRKSTLRPHVKGGARNLITCWV